MLQNKLNKVIVKIVLWMFCYSCKLYIDYGNRQSKNALKYVSSSQKKFHLWSAVIGQSASVYKHWYEASYMAFDSLLQPA